NFGFRPGRQFRSERNSTLADDRLAFGEFLFAIADVFADDGLEVVHVVEVNVFEFLDVRIDVARNSDIDQEQRPISARRHDGRDILAAQNGLGGTGRTYKDIRLNHPIEAFIETNGSPAKFLREVL